jgi:exosome complex RNA-binding protein Rrp42 (RNase PH superfamily)
MYIVVAFSIPEVTIDEMGEAQISEDVFNVFNLDAEQIPLLLSLTRVGGKYVVDATQEEEAASFTSIVFAFDTKGHILHTKKITSGNFYPEALKEIIPVIILQSLNLSVNSNYLLFHLNRKCKSF